ncbi:MAG: hypothetical protein RLZZ184_2377, partial [Cyanobacteriota bacterium]
QCAAVGARHAVGQWRIGQLAHHASLSAGANQRLGAGQTNRTVGRDGAGQTGHVTAVANARSHAKRSQRSTVFAVAHGPQTPRGVCHAVFGCTAQIAVHGNLVSGHP